MSTAVSTSYQDDLVRLNHLLYNHAGKINFDPQFINTMHSTMAGLYDAPARPEDKSTLLTVLLTQSHTIAQFLLYALPDTLHTTSTYKLRVEALGLTSNYAQNVVKTPTKNDYAALAWEILRCLVRSTQDRESIVRITAWRVIRYILQYTLGPPGPDGLPSILTQQDGTYVSPNSSNALSHLPGHNPAMPQRYGIDYLSIVILSLYSLGIDYYISRAIERDNKYSDERLQALKVLTIIMIYIPNLITRTLLISILSISYEPKDECRLIVLACLRHITASQPFLFSQVGGIPLLISTALDSSLVQTNIPTHSIWTILYYFDMPSTRHLLSPLTDIGKFFVPFTCTTPTISPEKEVLRAASHRSLLLASRSFSGLFALISHRGCLHSLLTTLTLPHNIPGVTWAKTGILELLYDILRVVTSYDIATYKRSVQSRIASTKQGSNGQHINDTNQCAQYTSVSLGAMLQLSKTGHIYDPSIANMSSSSDKHHFTTSSSSSSLDNGQFFRDDSTASLPNTPSFVTTTSFAITGTQQFNQSLVNPNIDKPFILNGSNSSSSTSQQRTGGAMGASGGAPTHLQVSISSNSLDSATSDTNNTNNNNTDNDDNDDDDDLWVMPYEPTSSSDFSTEALLHYARQYQQQQTQLGISLGNSTGNVSHPSSGSGLPSDRSSDRLGSLTPDFHTHQFRATISPSPRHINLLYSYMSLVLCVLLEAGLLEHLSVLSLSSHDPSSHSAVRLLQETLRLSTALFPTRIAAQLQAFPQLLHNAVNLVLSNNVQSSNNHRNMMSSSGQHGQSSTSVSTSSSSQNINPKHNNNTNIINNISNTINYNPNTTTSIPVHRDTSIPSLAVQYTSTQTSLQYLVSLLSSSGCLNDDSSISLHSTRQSALTFIRSNSYARLVTLFQDAVLWCNPSKYDPYLQKHDSNVYNYEYTYIKDQLDSLRDRLDPTALTTGQYSLAKNNNNNNNNNGKNGNTTTNTNQQGISIHHTSDITLSSNRNAGVASIGDTTDGLIKNTFYSHGYDISTLLIDLDYTQDKDSFISPYTLAPLIGTSQASSSSSNMPPGLSSPLSPTASKHSSGVGSGNSSSSGNPLAAVPSALVTKQQQQPQRPYMRNPDLYQAYITSTQSISDNTCLNMLKSTNILSSKDPFTWDWPQILDILETILLSRQHFLTAIKTKFFKRLLSFLRPDKMMFSELSLTIPHAAIHGKVAIQLVKVLVMYPEGREYQFFHQLLDLLLSCLTAEVNRAEKLAAQVTTNHNHPANIHLQTHIGMSKAYISSGLSSTAACIESSLFDPSTGDILLCGAGGNNNGVEYSHLGQNYSLNGGPGGTGGYSDRQSLMSPTAGSSIKGGGNNTNGKDSSTSSRIGSFFSFGKNKDKDRSNTTSGGTSGNNELNNSRVSNAGYQHNTNQNDDYNSDRSSSLRSSFVNAFKSPSTTSSPYKQTTGAGGAGNSNGGIGNNNSNGGPSTLSSGSGQSTGSQRTLLSIPSSTYEDNVWSDSPSGGASGVGGANANANRHPGTYLRPFTRTAITTKCSRYYIILLGTLTQTPYGITILSNYGFFDIIAPLAGYHSHDYLTRLFLFNIDFSTSRTVHHILDSWILIASTFIRRNIVSLLRSLFRSGSESYHLWAIELLLSLLYSPDVQVALSSLALLEEVCTMDALSLETCLNRAPNLIHFGHFATNLYYLFLSHPQGVLQLMRNGWIFDQLVTWKQHGCYEYLHQAESILANTLSKHMDIGDDDDDGTITVNTIASSTHINTNGGGTTATTTTNIPFPSSMAAGGAAGAGRTSIYMQQRAGNAKSKIQQLTGAGSSSSGPGGGPISSPTIGAVASTNLAALPPVENTISNPLPFRFPHLRNIFSTLHKRNINIIGHNYTLYNQHHWNHKTALLSQHDEYIRKNIYNMPWSIDIMITTSSHRNIALNTDCFVMDGYGDAGTPILSHLATLNPTMASLQNMSLYTDVSARRILDLQILRENGVDTSSLSSHHHQNGITIDDENDDDMPPPPPPPPSAGSPLSSPHAVSALSGGTGRKSIAPQTRPAAASIALNSLVRSVNADLPPKSSTAVVGGGTGAGSNTNASSSSSHLQSPPRTILAPTEIEGAPALYICALLVDTDGRPSPVEIDPLVTLSARLRPCVLSTDTQQMGTSVRVVGTDIPSPYTNFINQQKTRTITSLYIDKKVILDNTVDNLVIPIRSCLPGDRVSMLIPSYHHSDYINYIYDNNNTAINAYNWNNVEHRQNTSPIRVKNLTAGLHFEKYNDILYNNNSRHTNNNNKHKGSAYTSSKLSTIAYSAHNNTHNNNHIRSNRNNNSHIYEPQSPEPLIPFNLADIKTRPIDVSLPSGEHQNFYMLDGDVRWNFHLDNTTDTLYLVSVWYRITPTHDIAPNIQVVPHLYGQLAQTDVGCGLLFNSGIFKDLVTTLCRDAPPAQSSTSATSSHENDKKTSTALTHSKSASSRGGNGQFQRDVDHFLQRRSAAWALAHIGSSPVGIRLLIRSGLVAYFAQQALSSPILSLRGTFFYLLGLMSLSDIGRRHLYALGWDAPTSYQLCEYGIVLPRNMSTFLHVQSTPLSNSPPLQDFLLSGTHTNIIGNNNHNSHNNNTNNNDTSISTAISFKTGVVSVPSSSIEPSSEKGIIIETKANESLSYMNTLLSSLFMSKNATTAASTATTTPSSTPTATSSSTATTSSAHVDMSLSQKSLAYPILQSSHILSLHNDPICIRAVNLILGHISNLSNHVSQRVSLNILRSWKNKYIYIFMSPVVYVYIFQLLTSLGLTLPARRFVLYELFSQCDMHLHADLISSLLVPTPV